MSALVPLNLPALALCPKPAIDHLTDEAARLCTELFRAERGQSSIRLRYAADTGERYLTILRAEYAGLLRNAMEPLTAGETRDALSAFLLAWPNASKADLAGYGAQLLSDVLDANPCRHAVDGALRRLRRTSKFVPSIAEVLLEVESEQDKVRKLQFRITEHLPFLVARVAAWADESERVESARACRQQERLSALQESAGA